MPERCPTRQPGDSAARLSRNGPGGRRGPGATGGTPLPQGRKRPSPAAARATSPGRWWGPRAPLPAGTWARTTSQHKFHRKEERT